MQTFVAVVLDNLPLQILATGRKEFEKIFYFKHFL